MVSRFEQQTFAATVTYCLSEVGRKLSLKVSGSGSYHQNVSGLITPDDLGLFQRHPNGLVSVVFNQIEFDKPQRFEALLKLLRKRQGRLCNIRVLIEAEAVADRAFGGSRG
jgi:hypothetical protein